MASFAPTDCCVRGIKYVGEPKGQDIKIGNWDAYITVPQNAMAEAHGFSALLFIPDVIGIWQNSKLIADQFAANGYLTLVLDIYNGDALALNRPEGFDFEGWIAHGSTGDNPHTPKAIDPIVEAAIGYLREERGVNRLGAVGYCFGAKYVARHQQNGIDVGFIAHPSFVTEEELRGFRAPLSIASGSVDNLFPAEQRHQSEGWLDAKGDPWQLNVYSGVDHGFAVRGDPSSRTQRFGKEQAFLQAVNWFDYWLSVI
ncbi:dienelactone hydrolase [Hypoxylon sp. FL1150]|nr:dienelactone hydrolase [Hypoxylon sp. FL1150]